MSEEVEQKWISGFWRRIGALFIDTLLLGILGFILGLALEATFAEIGSWGRLVGFTIALVYFGIGNSYITGGQTIGKKALKLRVVNFENTSISVAKSFLRYSILAIPFSLNGTQFINESMLSYLIYPLSFLIIGGLCSIPYLYIFNRVTRQSLHDLIVGTYVVNTGVEKQEVGKVWKVHIIVAAVIFLAAAIAPVFTSQLAHTETFKDMLSVQAILSNQPNVNYATISNNTSTFSSVNEGTKTTTSISSQVFLAHNEIGNVELARQFALLVIENYPEARSKDVILITLSYGYDIGIWSQWSNYGYDFNPSELQIAE
jgi:uncharacterized RDD family membrane protein YckC